MNKYFPLLLLILIPVFSFSQESLIKDINLDVKNSDEIIINYNLIDSQKISHFVDIVLIDNQNNIYIPENTFGSVGSNVKNGKNTISFSLLDQSFPLDQELTPSIILNHKIKNGPNASLLSALIPGLGDYYVENPKNMVIKPYFKTLAVGGMLALAFIAESKKEDVIYYQDSTWVPEGYYSYRWRPAHYNVETYKTNPKDYWLFKNDKEVFIGVAAGIWLFDIFWVYAKGQQNNRIREALKNKNFKLELSSNGISYKLNLD